MVKTIMNLPAGRQVINYELRVNENGLKMNAQKKIKNKLKSCHVACNPTALYLGLLLFWIIAFVLSIALPQLAYGAGGDVSWEYGVARTLKQQADAMVVDGPGNVYVAGFTEEFGTQDFYTVKIKSDGTGIHWSKVYDKAGGNDEARAIVLDSDSNVIVTGFVSNGVNNDFYTVKYNSSDGAVLWEHTFNSSMDGHDYAAAIAVDSLNNVYVAGNSQGSSGADDFMIVKYGPNGPNPDGTPIWSKNYNGVNNDHDRVSSITAGTDGIAVTGTSRNATGDFDMLTIKYGFDSTLIWEKSKSASGDENGVAVGMDSSGNVIATGITYNGSNKDIYTAKYNAADGIISWEDTLNGGYDEEPAALQVDSFDNVYLTGYIFQIDSAEDVYTIRYSGSAGTVDWSSAYNSTNGDNDRAVGIVVDESGDLYVTGYSHDIDLVHDDFRTLKYSKDNGDLLWQKNYNGAAGKDERAIGVGLTAAGEVIVAGWTDMWTSGASDYDYYAIKYDPGLLNPPTGLTAATQTTTHVELNWTDNATIEDGFKIERKIGDFGTYSEIGTALANVTTYHDMGLTPDTKYYYRVRSYNTTDGDSHYSNETYAVTTIFTFITPSLTFTYGGPDSGDDFVSGIAAGPDYNPVLTGYSFSFTGQFDYYTVKLDRTDLSETWSERYDSDQNNMDMAASILVDGNNDVLVSGYSNLFSIAAGANTNDIYSIKYPADGPPDTWNDAYNGPALDDDRAVAVDLSKDGSNNYLIVGYGKNVSWDNDIFVIKVLSDSTHDWEAVPFDGGGDDVPSDAEFGPSGNVYITGRTHNGTDYDYITRKYSGSDGSVLWSKAYNINGSGDDSAVSLSVDSKGDVYVTGTSLTASGNKDIYTVKYESATGNILWEKLFNGLADGDDIAAGAIVDPVNDDVLVAGTALTGAGNNEIHIIRYDSAGNIVWERTLERAGSNENAMDIAIDLSGNVHIAGDTDDGSGKDMISVQYTHDGAFAGGTTYDGAAGGDDSAASVVVNILGEAFVGGYTTAAGGDADYAAYKISNNFLQSPTPFIANTHYTRVDLSWSDNSLNEDGYHLERKLEACDTAGTWTPFQTLLPGTLAYIDDTLSIGASYCYRIRTYTDSGDTSRWVEREVNTTTPTVPTGLTAAAISTTLVELNWTDTTSLEDGFVVERCMGAGCSDFAQIASVGQDINTYNDTDVCASSVYKYRVKSYRTTRWTTGYSNEASASTQAIPDSAPFNMSAARVHEAEMEILWTDTVDDETGYKVERCTGAAVDCTQDIDFTEIASQNTNTSLPVTLLRMDEASWAGTVDDVVDSSGNDNHGRSYSGANTVSGGVYNLAGNFDGTNDYIDLGNQADMKITGSQSIEMWLKPTNFSTRRNPFAKAYGGEGTITIETSGQVNYFYGTCGGNCNPYQSFTMTSAMQSGVWTHLVLVRDLVNMKLRWYKDGVLVNETNASYSAATASNMNAYIGKGYVSYFYGQMDEVAIYNRAISDSEIQEHFNNGISTLSRAYIDSGLDPSQPYTYRIRAYKDSTCGWNTTYTASSSAVTTLVDPSGLGASEISTTRVDLSWTDNTFTETGFTVERCTGAACDFTVVDMIDAVTYDVESYSDTSVCEGTSYNYRVRADRDTVPVWQSGWSAAASVSTSSISAAAPTLLTATVLSESEIDLEWTSNTTDESGFSIERCTGTGCSDYTEITTWEPDAEALLKLAMDEAAWTGTVNDAIDTSGNNNHGMSYGGATTIAEGYDGRAGSFDGSNDYLETQLFINQASGTAGATMEAWVYPTNLTGGGHALISTDNGGYDWSLLRNGSTWRVYTGSNEFDTGLSVDLNQWQHVAVVFNPASGVTFYKNGYQVTSTATISYDASDAGIVIARRSTGGENFAGRVDDAAVYNRPLSASEIAGHYELGIQAGAVRKHRDTGLNPGTTYQYRLKAYKTATCSWSTVYGNVAVEATDNVPAPSGLLLTVVDTATLKLDWTDNTMSETLFTIERCDGAGCDFSTIDATYSVGTDINTYSDNTLCESSTYSYRVRAEKDDGPIWTSDWTTPSEATTDTKAAPENILAASVSESSIELNWTDNVPDETGFKLLRCMGVGCTPDQTIASLDSTHAEIMVYHMDEASWNGTANEVIDASGNGMHARAYSGPTTDEYGKYGRAGIFDGTNDYVYSALNIDQSSSSPGVTMEAWVKPDSITGGWRHVISTDDDSVEWSIAQYNNTWRVYTGSSTWNTALTVDQGQWQHVVAVFTPGTGITFYKNGVSAFTASIAYNTDDRNITIGKRARNSSYFYDGRIDEVAVYNRPLTNTEIQQLYVHGAQSFASKRYTDTGLQPNETYRYRVWAYKDGTCPWESSYIEVDPSVIPPAPENLSAVTVNTTQIDLAWSDKTAAETGFSIERCSGAGCNTFVEINTVPTDTKAYSDITVCEGIEYNYRINAFKTAEWISGYSNESAAIATAKAAPTSLSAARVSEIQIDLAWTDNNSDETGFRIERCKGVGCSNFTEITTVGANVTSYSDTGLISGSTYIYQVRAYKTADCPWTTAYSNTASDLTVVADPNGLTATAVNTTEIALQWNDNTSSETSFTIERCEGISCSNFTLLNTIGSEETVYTDSTVCNSTSYTYRIIAQNDGLSENGGGCWSRRAPVNITDFESDYQTLLTVTYDADMKADFSDLRFYDETAGIERPYMITEKTDGVSATVRVKTSGNNDLYMYYGNASAPAASHAGRTMNAYDPANSAINTAFTKSASNPVLTYAAGGLWDDYHVYGKTVIKDGGLYKMWYGGHDGTSLRIGYATSPDGLSWTRDASNPVLDLGAVGTWDVTHVAYPVVVKEGSTYKMWFAGNDNTRWRIGYATSTDGISWTKSPSNPVLSNGATDTWDDLHVLTGGVVYENGTYKIWYSGHDDTRYRIGYATSPDGISWTKYVSNPVMDIGSNGKWDDANVYLTSVMKDIDGLYKMWYTGHDGSYTRIGLASSTDGISWSKYASPLVDRGANGTWDDYHTYSPYVFIDSDGTYKMWYDGYDGSRWRIGYADVLPLRSVAVEPSAATGTEEQSACFTFSHTWGTGYSNEATDVTPTPVAPSGLLAIASTDTIADLTWTDNSMDETGFRIERCEGAGCSSFTEINTTTENAQTFSDMTLNPEITYCFQVRAYKIATCGWNTTYTAESCDLTFSASPTTLTASALNSMAISLDWTDNAGDEDGYELEERIWNGKYIKIATLGPDATTYTDRRGVGPAKEYKYRVRAFRASDMSPYSNEAFVTTPAYVEDDGTCY